MPHPRQPQHVRSWTTLIDSKAAVLLLDKKSVTERAAVVIYGQTSGDLELTDFVTSAGTHCKNARVQLLAKRGAWHLAAWNQRLLQLIAYVFRTFTARLPHNFEPGHYQLCARSQ
jgi:hypothetical protein